MKKAPKMKILVFQHVPHESPGYRGLREREGNNLTVLELWKPYTMPDMREFDALIVLGGPMGVYDDFPSKEDELAIWRSMEHSIPMLGICLGSQLSLSARRESVQEFQRRETGERNRLL